MCYRAKTLENFEGDFTMNYSPELKDALLRRMLPPNNESNYQDIQRRRHFRADPS